MAKVRNVAENMSLVFVSRNTNMMAITVLIRNRLPVTNVAENILDVFARQVLMKVSLVARNIILIPVTAFVK